MILDQKTQQQLLLHPIYLFSQQLKQKTLKKSAIEGLSTIAIALGPKKTREDLLPYLTKVFLKETQEYRIIILKTLPELLPHIGKNYHACSLLQVVIDILCVFPQKDLRKQGFVCLQKILLWIDIQRAQKSIINTLKLLNRQEGQNIRELILKIIPKIYIAVNAVNEKDLLGILKSFTESQEDLILLSKQLPEIIKVMPPVPEKQVIQMFQILLQTKNIKVVINLVDSILLLTKALGQQKTSKYIKQIVEMNQKKQQETKIFNNTELGCAIINKIKQLQQLFSEQNLQPVICRIRNYNNQKQQVKNAILEVLDVVQLPEDTINELCLVPQSLQLRNTLGETLSRMNKTQQLLKLIQTSDMEFKVKIFPKLPTVSTVHLRILQFIMNGKNWRTKQTILQNIQKRLTLEEPVEIFVQKLSEFMGDKIASVRTGVSSLIAKIIVSKDLKYDEYKFTILKSVKSENWYQRQNGYLCILQILHLKKQKSQTVSKQQSSILGFLTEIIVEFGIKETIVNIRSIVQDILQWYKLQTKQLLIPYNQRLLE